ncbi:YkgJ family cysteine cluster protein [Desulfatirhabdium butyrativorans]|uniref:YkgJ family cysteine cluster protein n=1 Tax=Desulfatirhabdium butyrativorans TaxID=340467 RepID=UPI00041082E8|nr:YkgJ family cysteine cluster protein [Desulfatirhabdium butyrativorans]
MSCRRCGTCCKKGGPSLHLEDRELVLSGVLPLSSLVTIRKGEWVYDGKTQTIRASETEFVRIQGTGSGWRCLYWDEATRNCTLYADRPIECRALKCWDTREIEAIYDRPRLTRAEILEDVPGWLDLIRTHEKHCSIDRLTRLLLQCGNHLPDAGIEELVAFDGNMRKLTVERSGISPDILPFLYGRALREVIEQIRVANRSLI